MIFAVVECGVQAFLLDGRKGKFDGSMLSPCLLGFERWDRSKTFGMPGIRGVDFDFWTAL